MRKIGPLLVVVTLLGGWSVPAAASRPHQGTGRTIHFLSRTTAATAVDVPPIGSSLGDELVEAGDELRGTTKVGHDDGVCVLSAGTPESGEFLCRFALVLADGQLIAEALVDSSSFQAGSRVDLAILGGTGSFRAARGEIHIRVLNDTDSDVTIQVLGADDE